MYRQISIAIPTYNRSAMLLELLQSIAASVEAANAYDKVEVCISDNCSTDNTVEMLNAFIAASKIKVSYHVQETNIGPDRNFVACTHGATGEYIWLMGSDDALALDAIQTVLAEIGEPSQTVNITTVVKPDILLVDRFDCDINLKPRFTRQWLETNATRTIINLANADERASYIKACNSVGSIFAFLSSIIVNTKNWNATTTEPSQIGSCYMHAVKLFQIFFRSNGQMTYLQKPLVYCRGDNDTTFSAQGMLARAAIDFKFFSSDWLTNLAGAQAPLIFKVIQKEWPLKIIRRIFRQCENPAIRLAFKHDLVKVYGHTVTLLFFNAFTSAIGHRNQIRRAKRNGHPPMINRS